ncbi:A/G-specific adenine DNA glycosylase [Tolypocladium capitatum]|uniref:Adenine DNA glycosylase n=1 Tax=Tolypocladium capitatum TaxID=45235 RepID=A0A2K3QI30_9HYPO|nr:A/G-specific adenine DNA glycosylase [Tolypocladium capitatum]
MTRKPTRLPPAEPSRDGVTQKRPRRSLRLVLETRPRERPRETAAADGAEEADEEATARPRGAKRRKVASSRSLKFSELSRRLFGEGAAATTCEACAPPARQHSLEYHRPLLLTKDGGPENRRSLLSWFDSVSETRAMPWRKPWINPRLVADPSSLREALERRAYEVWISEIMLQQTRVAAVIEYWNRWMDRWPTIHDLARADPEDVLAAWRGLGYYSRATRIHEAAKLVVQDTEMRGLLPAAAVDLEGRVPGVGRYTAGAISSIVFGRAEPMVDGNVLRVLSRQLGIYGNVKADKLVIGTVWAAADALVKAVAADGEPEDEELPGLGLSSDRPGRWGQALMELGSTVCTPRPNCSLCPVTATCRVYGEGMALAGKKTLGPDAVDVEDVCSLCEPFEEAVDGDDEEAGARPATARKQPGSKKQLSLADFAFKAEGSRNASATPTRGPPVEAIADHARKFPLKTAKKAVREGETLVCAIQRPDGSFLIHRRPQKGLLAGLWELPSSVVDGPGETTAKQRVRMAESYASTLLAAKGGRGASALDHVGALGSVPWLFSHLKLTMHVHLFRVRDVKCDAARSKTSPPSRWSDDVESESMGTGMRRCWALVRDATA